MRSRSLLVGVCLSVNAAIAAPTVIGPVHPVVEPDVIEWMKERAREIFTPAKLAEMKEEQQSATRRYLKNPPGVSLPRAREPATRWVDLSVTVPYDLRDHEGRLIHPAGTRINPLEWRALTRTLVFFDATDHEQVMWVERTAEAEEWRIKPIAVAGQPIALWRAWQHPVSFDQQGLLVAKLGIQHLPALVRQEGLHLRIDEVALQ